MSKIKVFTLHEIIPDTHNQIQSVVTDIHQKGTSVLSNGFVSFSGQAETFPVFTYETSNGKRVKCVFSDREVSDLFDALRENERILLKRISELESEKGHFQKTLKKYLEI